MRIALSSALLLALASSVSAQTLIRRPIVVVRPAPVVERQVVVEVPRPAPVVRETPLIGIRPGCLSVLGFPLVCARL